jgi:hypothetical protein
MPALTLYHIAPSRSSTVLWMLEEIGEPYGIHLLSMKKGDNRERPYLDINPMGKVPALKHGDVVITEAAAICCYLADAFPADSVFRSATQGAGLISNGCSSGRPCWKPRSSTAPFRVRASRRGPRSAMAISTPR